MSVDPLKQAVAGRWQVPLFVFASGLLVIGIVRLRPSESVFSFDEGMERVVALRRGELFPQALELLDRLAAVEDRTLTEQARITRSLAETLFFQQRRTGVIVPQVARGILEQYAESEAGGIPIEAVDHQRMGQVNEWLARLAPAIDHYRSAVEMGIDRPLDLRRRIVELLARITPVAVAEVHAELDALLAAAESSPDHLLWAAQQKVALWSREGRHEDSAALLDQLRPKLINTAGRDELDWLWALTLVHFGPDRYNEAERELRSLRDRLALSDSLHARTGWLLGELNLRDDRPQAAMAFFSDVLRNHGSGEYRAASFLGNAVALARLQRFDASLAEFERLIAMLPQLAASEVVNPTMVRTALTTLAESLKPDESRQTTALELTRLARSLARSDDAVLQTRFAESMATIYAALARSKRRLAEARDDGLSRPDSAERETLLADSRRYFVAAGDEYHRLARLLTLSEASSADAAWSSIEMYEQAGLTQRHIAELKAFIANRPEHGLVPDARNRLGRAYQQLGALQSASEQYRRNVREHPRAIPALHSRIELAATYISLGGDNLDLAEQTLLELVDQSGGPELVTPAAEEFKDGLFLLARLYERRGHYEEVIPRLDEFLNRYGDDPRAEQAGFLLAEAYRQSAEAIRRDLGQAVNAVRREQLETWRRQRLERANALYGRSISAVEARPKSTHTPLEATRLALSHFYRADCAFDLGQYARAIELYEEATLKYEDDPSALAGYVQMVRCHHRLGNSADARQAIRRGRILVKKIADEAFARERQRTGGAESAAWDRAEWQAYFDWLADSSLFAQAGV